MSVSGCLISVEGLDGSGKSTLLAALQKRLERLGLGVLALRDPGGTDLAERIRQLLLEPKGQISPTVELFLFLAARADLTFRRIRPALAEGRWVLLDRFSDSTMAYQAFGRGVVGPERCAELNDLATGGLKPDLTLWLDAPLKVALARKRGQMADRIEQAEEAFYERVQAGYRWIWEREPDRVVRLRAEEPFEIVLEAAWEVVRGRFVCAHFR
ncbi:MAG: dTMP kinase [Bacteroidetes bacterium]|nr:dTMP kinase [Rhodothermia bacterium]MCS7154271.1 dTMP kinase [Bacteroidota bacterium]MCX7906693.1 dTMP kinase [Bacteroidota bacterium]MDW8137027.1 dTMP kinase [Bacteroidota bacterium]MDW8285102.1 dTMP kinase [Bacteroidota bacterium]